MTEEELLQAIRVEIREAFRQDREATIKDFCKRIGFNLESNDDYISQNKASKILGRSRLKRYMEDGTIPKGVGWYTGDDSRWGRIWINRDIVMRLKNKHKL